MKYVVAILASIVVFMFGYVTGQFFSHTNFDFVNSPELDTETTDESVVETETKYQEVQIQPSDLTPGQQELAEKYGIDISKITPAVIGCAEAKLGSARITEITKGAEPTFAESLQLLACYSTK